MKVVTECFLARQPMTELRIRLDKDEDLARAPSTLTAGNLEAGGSESLDEVFVF